MKEEGERYEKDIFKKEVCLYDVLHAGDGDNA